VGNVGMGCPRRRWATGGTGSSTRARPGWTWWAVADRAAAAPRVRGAEARSRGGDGAAADLAERLGVRRRCPFADLEALRAAHGVSVSRFAALAGIPERTYWRRLARHGLGDPPKAMAGAESGRDRGSRREVRSGLTRLGAPKIAAMMRADGHQVSTSTVQRALRRRGLLLPTGFRADRRSWARLRKRVFRDPPRQRNRVWQMDFSEFETARGGIWRICAVIDDATKYGLAATVTPTLAARKRGNLRRIVRGCATAGIVGTNSATPIEPRRRPRGQPRPMAHRARPHALGSTHTRLCRSSDG
jgi:hypothetical protein